ncbi:AbrB/MazE/SpoVT family DNA-binding domain-containing protein [Aureimonas sp. Leaf324]|jgi:AbrB family looped-hinge helix DNA binding protein|uniref:AbrB/MazE/SpoVT family DNA-binding domain-containing protein n=1 Tax=Aureimonas sp. Leaf324 TaxID=1736336 RepID=UPI0006FF2593|nr:AbrB/MazE/SpoVT family DNA-binding domain-containing protein [Aureimonas sp. Leaf324]KQQ85956.1 sporulation regulator [Aureimonas sp. Leaf324]
MRVTEKGQVTIPKPIRDKLGIGPGSEVEFVDRGDHVELVREELPSDPKLRREEIRRRLDALRGTIDTHGMDGKEFIDWLRGPRDDLDPR